MVRSARSQPWPARDGLDCACLMAHVPRKYRQLRTPDLSRAACRVQISGAMIRETPPHAVRKC